MSDYSARIERARQLLHESSLGCLLLSVGSDLPYFTGYQAMPLERLTMLVISADEAVLVVPELEAPRVAQGPFAVRPWSETEDPVGIVAGLVPNGSVTAIGDHTWSVFLLGLQERLPGTKFVSATPLTRVLRIRKEEGEIGLLRRAAEGVDRVVDRLRRFEFSGTTERELASLVSVMTIEEGHDTAGMAIVASGPNGASPHHEPSDRVIELGDLVVVDFGGRVGGYYSDITRTFVVGGPTPEQAKVHGLVNEAQAAATAMVRPGVAAEAVDAAAREVITDGGYGAFFIHRTGHGIGLEGHEHPYLVAGNDEKLEQGMCFSIEPGIYLPGRFGVRLEDIVVVTEVGVEPLNRADHSLLEVG
jgi:Xaa-Pro aminopeptidase